MLDPSVGVWLQEDPIGFLGGDGNLHRYVGNNATNGVDPSGLADDRAVPKKPPAYDGEAYEIRKETPLASLKRSGTIRIYPPLQLGEYKPSGVNPLLLPDGFVLPTIEALESLPLASKFTQNQFEMLLTARGGVRWGGGDPLTVSKDGNAGFGSKGQRFGASVVTNGVGLSGRGISAGIGIIGRDHGASEFQQASKVLSTTASAGELAHLTLGCNGICAHRLGQRWTDSPNVAPELMPGVVCYASLEAAKLRKHGEDEELLIFFKRGAGIDAGVLQVDRATGERYYASPGRAPEVRGDGTVAPNSILNRNNMWDYGTLLPVIDTKGMYGKKGDTIEVWENMNHGRHLGGQMGYWTIGLDNLAEPRMYPHMIFGTLIVKKADSIASSKPGSYPER